MRRVGTLKIKYEARTQIFGEPIYIGAYEYRRDAIAAEQVALTIRRALERAMAIRRHKEQSISFQNLNQSEQAA
jgi:ribosomal protein S3